MKKIKIYLWADCENLTNFNCAIIDEFSFSKDQDLIVYIDSTSLILAKHKLFHFGKEFGKFICRIRTRNNFNFYPDFEIFNGSHKPLAVLGEESLRLQKSFPCGALNENQLDFFIQGLRSVIVK